LVFVAKSAPSTPECGGIAQRGLAIPALKEIIENEGTTKPIIAGNHHGAGSLPGQFGRCIVWSDIVLWDKL